MMKRLGFAIAAAALGLSGLSGGAGIPAAVAQAGPQVDRAFLLGRWTDNGNCAGEWVEFYADGRFATNAGAGGTWTLRSGQLTFIGQRTIAAQVRATDRNTITLTHPDGSVGGSTRCPSAGARRLTVPPVPSTAAGVLAISRPFNRAFLFGRWTDSGDCNETIHFRPDGSFVVPTGNGRWTLNGEQLSFIGNTTVTARARAVGRDRILLIHPDGRIGQSLRC